MDDGEPFCPDISDTCVDPGCPVHLFPGSLHTKFCVATRTANKVAGCYCHNTAASGGRKDDPVTYPSHYTSTAIEVIDVIEAFKLPFHLGNTIKYVLRAGRKDPAKLIEDLKKARWYLDRYISNLEK